MTAFPYLPALTGFVAGLALGAMYFGGLWWSVMRLKQVERKKLFLFVSWAVRSVLLCVGLYAMAKQGSALLLGGAVGVLAARMVIVRAVKRKILPVKTKAGSEC